MIDHVLGRPSNKSRRLQVLVVLAFWSTYLFKGDRHGPPLIRFLSRFSTRFLTAWQTVVVALIYLYAARNFSTLVGLSSADPLANMYDPTYFRATWVLTALDAGFWTAMKIRSKWVRDIASLLFSAFYLVAADQADEKVRKVRGNLTVEHLRVSWNKGTQSPYLRFLQGLVRPRFTRWPPRAVRIPRPAGSDYTEPVAAWLYYDGPLADLEHHTKVVLDIPGGGFVAMDPRCNDDRLLAWASKTRLPVLSLDYKKAPEYPYPYALNECYDVYTTLIKSKGRCIGLSGTEAPHVVIIGDSAGGNLAAAMTLMVAESGIRRIGGQSDLPVPDAVILCYPALDMNIGNWMSDEQMALIKDRRSRGTNKRVARRKSMQYNDLVGTPHHSDDEEDDKKNAVNGLDTITDKAISPSRADVRSPAPEFAHASPSTWKKSQPLPPSAKGGSEPLHTRLAMSSMISYFNDRVLTPELMRAMIILYIGPHTRPDFTQDYLLCPILAPDALLARFPKTYFLTGERDPLVDDTVIFAGRLRRVKAALHASGGARLDYREQDAEADGFDDKSAAEVALIPGTSHGLLQFPSIYSPAWKLMDRTARWIEDAFVEARQRERARKRANIVNARNDAATNGTDGRHHVRRDSSDAEDKPLEIKMTRIRAPSLRTGSVVETNGTQAESGEEAVVDEDADVATDSDTETEGSANSTRSKKRRKKKGLKRDLTLIKLKSSDDLLGRRMQGLAAGLTGLADDE